MEDDPCIEELDTISAIYPESIIDKSNRTLESVIPIEVTTSITLVTNDINDLIINVDHLPRIKARFQMSEKYPFQEPPAVDLDAVWLDDLKKHELLKDLQNLWLDFHDCILFTYMDFIKSKFEEELIDLKIPIEQIQVFEEIQKFDLECKINEFNSKTFSCGICLEDFKGINCTQFQCSHTFCNKCLHDFFKHKITRGEIDDIHCPSIECTKLASENALKLKQSAESYKITNWDEFDNVFFQLPVKLDLLERVFHDDRDRDAIIKRYLEFSHSVKLNRYQIWFPRRVVTCPRETCKLKFIKRDIDDYLTICSSCTFAFCSRCKHSWHGVNPCMLESSMVSKDDLSIWIANNNYLFSVLSDTRDFTEFIKLDEDEREGNLKKLIFTYGRDLLNRLSREWISDIELKKLLQSDSSKIVECPSCKCYIEKFEGCNKVRCSQCETNFCFLCSQILLKDDPYIHFTEGPCSGLLFQGILINE